MWERSRLIYNSNNIQVWISRNNNNNSGKLLLKTMKDEKLELNIFDSNISNLQQGWRLVIAVYRQAQTELRLGSREATDSTYIPKQFSTPSQLAGANAVTVFNNLPSGQCCCCCSGPAVPDDHLKECLNQHRHCEDSHHYSQLSVLQVWAPF